MVVLGPRGLALDIVGARCPVAVLVHLEMLTVFLGKLAALGSLLDRQADAATGEVEIDDLDPQLFTGSDNLLRSVDMMGAHLADVHQTFDAFADLRERAERHELGDAAVDQLAHFMTVREDLPWVLLGGLEREADSLTIEVDVEHLHGDWVADRDDSTRMIDMLPREFTDVNEPVHTAEIDERTKADHAADDTGTNFARLEIGEELVAGFLLGLLQVGAPAEHNVVAVLVELDDLGLNDLAHIGLQVAHPAQFHERGRQEAAKADVDDQAALDDLDDETLDHAIDFLELFDVAPGTLVLRTLLRQQQTTFFVFLLQDERFDLFAELHDLVRVDIVADAQLASKDDAFALVADVEKDFVAVDLDHGAVDQLAILDFDEGAGDCIGEGHAEVV